MPATPLLRRSYAEVGLAPILPGREVIKSFALPIAESYPSFLGACGLLLVPRSCSSASDAFRLLFSIVLGALKFLSVTLGRDGLSSKLLPFLIAASCAFGLDCDKAGKKHGAELREGSRGSIFTPESNSPFWLVLEGRGLCWSCSRDRFGEGVRGECIGEGVGELKPPGVESFLMSPGMGPWGVVMVWIEGRDRENLFRSLSDSEPPDVDKLIKPDCRILSLPTAG